MTNNQSAPEYPVTRTSNPRSDAEREALLAAPLFGTVFTDHMARAYWTPESDWHDRAVVPYAPITLDPAAAVLHYGQEVFEGLKAYRHEDGSIWGFRPEHNARRMMASSRRLALPEISEEDFMASIEALLSVDAAWVPTPNGGEASLYLRPFLFASEAFIGVRSAKEVTYLLIASPVGAYFAKGVNPVSIWVSQDYNRSGPGGTGTAKCGGNYAASLLPQEEGAAQGCDQVCFLDAATGTYLEELGGMNLFMVHKDGRVVTPSLTGSILEGVTRDSIITLLQQEGVDVTERRISLAELRSDIEAGRISEMFACGTAAVITPIGSIAGRAPDETIWRLQIAGGNSGELTTHIRESLLDIQFGRTEDRHNWLRRIV